MWSFAAVLMAAVIVAFLPATAMAVSEYDQIAGVSGVTAAQLERELASVNPNHIHPGIAQLYVEWGYRFGIRADIAFAQMLLETNYLRYGGDVSPSQNNFAGIGATGGGNPGNSFATPELGVIGQYAHLAWYAYPDHQNEFCNTAYDPRHFGSGHVYTAPLLYQLGGRWAVPGTTYGRDIARLANQIWRWPQSGHVLGSFNEVTGTPDSELSTIYYFPWYDSMASHGMAGNWIMVGNQGAGEAVVRIWLGDILMDNPDHPGTFQFTIPEGGQIVPMFANTMGGPVKVVSTGGQPLIASQRVLYGDTFTEVRGLRHEDMADDYLFTWYDSLPQNGMGGNWILIANEGSQAAEVEVWIGGVLRSEYKAAQGNALAPGQVVTPWFVNTAGGPVEVRSVNHQPLIASQRVVFRESFNETMGFKADAAATEFNFTWYDSEPAHAMGGDWIIVANRGSAAADVRIWIGTTLMDNPENPGTFLFTIPVGGIATPYFAHLTDGPVRVASTNGQPVFASQRVVYRESLEEVVGVLPAQLASDQWFTWYDSALSGYMWGDWLMIANKGSGTANVEIYIGDTLMENPDDPGSYTFPVSEGGYITPTFRNRRGGPVRVVATSGQPLLVSQRVLYKEGLIR